MTSKKERINLALFIISVIALAVSFVYFGFAIKKNAQANTLVQSAKEFHNDAHIRLVQAESQLDKMIYECRTGQQY